MLGPKGGRKYGLLIRNHASDLYMSKKQKTTSIVFKLFFILVCGEA